jgi:hypothetical protein
MLAIHPTFNLIFDILLRDPQERLRSYKLLNRTAPCQLVFEIENYKRNF